MHNTLCILCTKNLIDENLKLLCENNKLFDDEISFTPLPGTPTTPTKDTNKNYDIVLKVTSTQKRQLLKMCHLKHRLRIFLFDKKIVPFSKYASFCIFNHPMIYQICDVVMSIGTQDRVLF